MAILLIRHGETEGNRTRVIQRPDTPLSEAGRAQAARLAERLRAEPIVRILASDYARADETARAVSASTGVDVDAEPLLQERNLGDLRGRAYADLAENPFGPDYAPPGGETWEQFHDRVDRAWENIRAAAEPLEGHLAVVTHGLVLHSLSVRHLRLPDEVETTGHNGPPLHFSNTALSVVEAEPPWRVTLHGCAAHLGDLPTVGLSGL